ncbi:nucleotide-binding universal stress UspA family protein [Flavobacterium nitrogenifigens]|uniref:Nucleotide-binding universal stress UspA family protein n=2 Tax=Flavobacterium TaxID=237 RepID=A0A7W7ITF8_9FLAO|nr:MULTISPECIES: universal stress protein [Flavobacterium]MBB4800228.1 nucleotide-binding universal stress UspA family protein [Flavobacterium nitrogenifigens]MBB6386022.1 nucleotide-binding universal stress UspA family protein [Flavobacterium notoginsengisoli]
MKRILVPTDFSEHAEDALKVASQIAKKNNSEIIILHMLELPHQSNDAIMGGISIPETMLFMKKANEMLDEVSSRSYLDGISITEVVKMDKPIHGITQISKDYEVDLIIMGSHGSSGIEELLIGSNTEKVVRNSEIPVLIIKKNISNFDAANIVFASDFSEEAKKPFEKLLNFTKLFDSKLHLVNICTPNSFKPTHIAEKAMNDFASHFNISNYTTQIYNDTNIEKGIINFSNKINADIIGMCTHGRTGFAHFFNGSISEGLVNHAVRPVITLKI